MNEWCWGVVVQSFFYIDRICEEVDDVLDAICF